MHANEITDRGLRVSPGTQVAFRVLEGDRRLKAYDVRILDGQDEPAPVPAGNGHAAERRPVAAEERSGVLAEQEFLHQLTELLLTAAPQLTGGVIVELRGQLLEFARKNGWVE